MFPKDNAADAFRLSAGRRTGLIVSVAIVLAGCAPKNIQAPRMADISSNLRDRTGHSLLPEDQPSEANPHDVRSTSSAGPATRSATRSPSSGGWS
jgi:hypothetical protein